jgi:hypothetical protein
VRNNLDLKLWQSSTLFCGVDEVGRGALAGPVVAAAVIHLHEKLVFAFVQNNVNLFLVRFMNPLRNEGLYLFQSLSLRRTQDYYVVTSPEALFNVGQFMLIG